jgi:hypothetical protein
VTRRVRRFGIQGSLRKRLYLPQLLRHLASASHRTEAAMTKRWGRDVDALLAECRRHGWAEYHSVETYSWRITAAGRAALKKLSESAKQKAA